MQRIPKSILLGLLLACFARAGIDISPEQLHWQAQRSRDAQLVEIQESAHPRYDAHLGLGWLLLPFPSQVRLNDAYGLHDGFAFRHRFSLLLMNPLEGSFYKIGVAAWLDRHGWDTEDFLVLPKYGKFATIRNLQTYGVFVANGMQNWSVGIGPHFQNSELVGITSQREGDSLFWWSQVYWRLASAQILTHGAEVRTFRIALDLQARELQGGATQGWTTYLPDTWYAHGLEDKLGITQNLWRQKLYASGSTILGPSENEKYSSARSFALAYHPDESHLVTFEATYALPQTSSAWNSGYFGWGLEVPFVRISYNHPREYEAFFGSRGLFLCEVHLALQSISQQAFFRRNAPRRAPMDSKLLPVRKNVKETP